MTLQFLLVLVFVAGGEVHVEVGGYENGLECHHARQQQVEGKRTVLVADCIPVSKAWGLAQ